MTSTCSRRCFYSSPRPSCRSAREWSSRPADWTRCADATRRNRGVFLPSRTGITSHKSVRSPTRCSSPSCTESTIRSESRPRSRIDSGSGPSAGMFSPRVTPLSVPTDPRRRPLSLQSSIGRPESGRTSSRRNAARAASRFCGAGDSRAFRIAASSATRAKRTWVVRTPARRHHRQLSDAAVQADPRVVDGRPGQRRPDDDHGNAEHRRHDRGARERQCLRGG